MIPSCVLPGDRNRQGHTPDRGHPEWPGAATTLYRGASIWGSASVGSACLDASVVSDSLRPHEPWLARLLCLCNSPGKNTGVGCYFPLCLLALGNFNNKHLLQSGKSGGCCSLVTKSCPTLLPPQWTAARQAPLSMRSPRKYWREFPCPPPGDLPDPGMEPKSPALAGGFFTTEPPGSPVEDSGYLQENRGVGGPQGSPRHLTPTPAPQWARPGLCTRSLELEVPAASASQGVSGGIGGS